MTQTPHARSSPAPEAHVQRCKPLTGVVLDPRGHLPAAERGGVGSMASFEVASAAAAGVAAAVLTAETPDPARTGSTGTGPRTASQ
jgi:hypothetical protein